MKTVKNRGRASVSRESITETVTNTNGVLYLSLAIMEAVRKPRASKLLEIIEEE